MHTSEATILANFGQKPFLFNPKFNENYASFFTSARELANKSDEKYEISEPSTPDLVVSPSAKRSVMALFSPVSKKSANDISEKPKLPSFALTSPYHSSQQYRDEIDTRIELNAPASFRTLLISTSHSNNPLHR